jgi:hypothetical protein
LCIYKWPAIEPGVTLKEWENDATIIHDCTDRYSMKKKEWNTFLKAFYGAPCWTLQELNAFSAVLKNHGFHLVKGKRGSSDVPKKFAKTCVSRGHLGERKK